MISSTVGWAAGHERAWFPRLATSVIPGIVPEDRRRSAASNNGKRTWLLLEESIDDPCTTAGAGRKQVPALTTSATRNQPRGGGMGTLAD
jgi:hypothetical protein